MKPYKIDSSPERAREGDIPYYAKWNDGSEYRVVSTGDKSAIRSFQGPMFGRELEDWKFETFSW